MTVLTQFIRPNPAGNTSLLDVWQVVADGVLEPAEFPDRAAAEAHQVTLSGEGKSSQLYHLHHVLVREPVQWVR